MRLWLVAVVVLGCMVTGIAFSSKSQPMVGAESQPRNEVSPQPAIKPTEPLTTMQCTSTAIGYLIPESNGGIHMPAAQLVELNVEVPKGGTPTAAGMFALVNGAWIACAAGSHCGPGSFPQPFSVNTRSADVDGSLSYTITVGAVAYVYAGGGGAVERGPVKLSVDYTIQGDTCVSQAAWEIAQNHEQPMALFVPTGKAVIGFDTFAKEINGPTWFSCDVWNQNTSYQVKDNCNQPSPSNPPGGIGFPRITFVNETGVQQPAGTGPGIEFVCSNSATIRRDCRARIRYK